SDRPRAVNHNFIEQAAQLAVDRLRAQVHLSVEPALDRDTQDVSGSPAIAESILEKIDTCGIFLADVTLVQDEGAKRFTPNPNVLIELGYAAARVGWNRTITVMNEAFGGPSKLPFDLQHRRWPTRYRLSGNADAETVRSALEKLSEEIEGKI